MLARHEVSVPNWEYPAVGHQVVAGKQPSGNPRTVQPVFPWKVMAAVIAHTAVNFQQKLATEPHAVALYGTP